MTEQPPVEAPTTVSSKVADGLTDADPATLVVPDPPPLPALPAPQISTLLSCTFPG